MLTRVEMMALNWIYVHCTKSFPVPFEWENRKMSLKLNHNITNIYNCITWIVLLLTLASRCIMLPKIIDKGDINGSIIHGLLWLYNISAAVLKLNILLYKADLVQLINQSLLINSVWGMCKVTACDL